MSQFIQELESAVATPRRMLLSGTFFQQLKAGTLTKAHYARHLVEIYHYVKHSTRLLAAAAARFGTERQALFTRFIDHADEEAGHEEWALNDLRTLGIDTKKVVASTPLPATDAMIGLQYYLIEHVTPVALFGYIYALETLGSGPAGELATLLKHVLGVGDDALSFLLGHSESDIGHVEKLRAVIEANVHTPAEQAAIVRCAVASYSLYAVMMSQVWDDVKARQ
jgi:pyrroloquinoline quinone (PQQ) biosynthesis protein C